MKYLIIWLMVLVFLVTFSLAEINQYYKIELHYDQSNVSYVSVNVEPFSKEIEELGADYLAEVVDYQGQVLNETFFSFPNIILWDGIDEKTGKINSGGIIVLNKSKTTVYLPYSETAKEIQIFDENVEKILTIDVSDLSKKVPQNITKNQNKKWEQQELKKVNQKEAGTNFVRWVLIGIGLLVLIVVVGFVLYKKRK